MQTAPFPPFIGELKIRIGIRSLGSSLAVYEVKISLKEGIVDPEGENTKKSLELLRFHTITHVSSYKLYSISLRGKGKETEGMIEDMCRKLLANPAIHMYSYRKVSD